MAVEISNDKGFIFTTSDLEDPRGMNGLSAFAASYQRTLYKDYIYPSKEKGFPTPLDTWYAHGYYGRMDQYLNAVVLRSTTLAQLPGGDLPVFAPNFIVNAFSQLRDHMANAYLVGAVNKAGNPAMLNLRPKAGYVDPSQKYNEFHADLATQFARTFRPPREAPITDFSLFLKYYARFLKTIAHYFPLTKTNYILSYASPPMGTGLSVAIDGGNAADDPFKYESYITDPNFKFYTSVAKRFGFLVNKNKPWVLTADLFTGPTLAFLSSYLNPRTYRVVNESNFYNTYYTPAYTTDFPDLRRTLVSAYMFLARSAPYYQKEHILPDGTFTYSSYARDLPTQSILANSIPADFLIDLYLDLRQIESGHPYTPHELKSIRYGSYKQYALRLPPRGEVTEGPYTSVARYIQRYYAGFIAPLYNEQLIKLPDALEQQLRRGQPGEGGCPDKWRPTGLVQWQHDRRTTEHSRERPGPALTDEPIFVGASTAESISATDTYEG